MRSLHTCDRKAAWPCHRAHVMVLPRFLSAAIWPWHPHPKDLPRFAIRATMAEISHCVAIQYKEEPKVLIPTDMIHKKNNKTYVQLRPTSNPIVQLLTGRRGQLNASLSSSATLQRLVKKRNAEYDKPPPAAAAPEQLFEDAPSPKASKKRGPPNPSGEDVAMAVKDTTVHCLMQGKRPRATDLTVELEADQLTAIIEAIREEDVDQVLNQAKRSYQKKRRL